MADDDLIRERLFNVLQKSGIQNTVKAKLRSELIKLIGKRNFLNDLESTENTIQAQTPINLTQNQKSLITKLTDQLISAHLKNSNYEYSSSVFNTEAGIEKELPIKISNFVDLQDAKHRYLLDKKDLNEIIRHLFVSKTVGVNETNSCNSECQTSSELLTFSEKMGLIESRRKMAIDGVDRSSLRDLEKQVEARVEAKYERNLQRELLKNSESIRHSERLKHEKSLAEITNQTKLKITVQEQALLERERNQKDRIASTAQLTQQEIHQQRQQVLEQTEKNAVYQKSLDLLKSELELKQNELQKQKAEQDQFDKRFEEKVRLHKIECKNDVLMELKSDRIELEKKCELMRKSKITVFEREAGVAVREKDLVNQEERHGQIQEDYKCLMEKLKASEIRQQTLQVRLDQMHDYESVKEMNGLLTAQIDSFPGKSAKDFMNIQTRWSDQVSELRSLLNRVEQANLDSMDKQIVHKNPARRVIERSPESLLDMSTTSVSSLVQEMKQRFDKLGMEASNLNEQYESYKIGNY